MLCCNNSLFRKVIGAKPLRVCLLISLQQHLALICCKRCCVISAVLLFFEAPQKEILALANAWPCSHVRQCLRLPFATPNCETTEHNTKYLQGPRSNFEIGEALLVPQYWRGGGEGTISTPILGGGGTISAPILGGKHH